MSSCWQRNVNRIGHFSLCGFPNAANALFLVWKSTHAPHRWLENVEALALPVMWYGEFAMIRDDKADEFTTYYLAEDAQVACQCFQMTGLAKYMFACFK